MPLTFLAAILISLTVFGFYLGRSRALALAGGRIANLHSLPGFYGWYVAIWCGLPALLVFAGWIAFEDTVVRNLVVAGLPEQLRSLPQDQLGLVISDIRNMAFGNIPPDQADAALRPAVDHYVSLRRTAHVALGVLVICIGIIGLFWGRSRIAPDFRARNRVEQVAGIILVVASVIAVLTTVGIVLSLIFEAMRFFAAVSPLDFLFGTVWSPQTAIRADQVGSSGAFGAVPLFTGTLLIATIAMLVAVPVGLMAAVYMAEYAGPKLRAWAKPALEILAGIPTVVYGFFAALTVAPLVRRAGESVGLEVASQSALAAGLVMGIMIIPFVSSLSDDVINAVPQSLRDGSYGLGATQSETIKKVILPAALPGIAASIILAFSRALGETMIVVMAAGLAANLTANPLAAVTTVTVHIASLLVGDQEFDSPKTLAAFALGLVLFAVTLGLNIVALRIVKKYREQYD
ncbi:MAG TPA: phosphate ABC transporter permease subunit PstC [Ferrovibrio sp.]|jgi:phosphate transport system permease protein|uniref:phosphate ABC transporter permease subunit PstC n=1 Tax=Ferrovibrio sp. TaxID=1917215 RepID=UPI002B4B4C71|nr:phosphate ABC transporter permease subunit PstC [Ferrovibrio sp.]HLT76702.1 phosphate ABC transporter permease subunit PstC [Ferrovibrio sp.]